MQVGALLPPLPTDESVVPASLKADVRLPRDADFEAPLEGNETWGYGIFGRIVVGLVVSLGGGVGAEQIVPIITRELSSDWLTELLSPAIFEFLVTQVAFSPFLLMGAAMAASTQPRGLLLAGMIGVLHGLALHCLYSTAAVADPAFIAIGQTAGNAVLGWIGGWIGLRIWPPPPRLLVHGARAAAGPIQPWGLLAGKIHWFRILVGSCLATAGVAWTGAILQFLLTRTTGGANFTHSDSDLFRWGITAASCLVGGVAAGSSTFNGLKQGLFVAFLVSTLVVGLSLGKPAFDLDRTLSMLGVVVGFSIVGGWFGASLLPPLVIKPKRKGSPFDR